ncbi:MAG: rubrerythrin [Candidatus Omnitrophica bacterium]|nr:rubrerythrin [Candidatus Omnitrophota bacterium]MBU1808791.1 rubrerythrin [Candidatus Omnitrophota bacterium]
MLTKKSGFAVVFGVMLFLLPVCISITSVYAQEKPVDNSATTLDNLMTAYNAEVNANARYIAFSKKANEEGYDIAASLFRATAAAEQVHYERHGEVIKKLGGTPNAIIETPVVNSTTENIESAFRGEVYEKDLMYPAFLKQAEKEKIEDAIDAFEDAGAAEGVHAELYAGMLKNLTISRGLSKDFYVCPVCGNAVDAVTSAMCPICLTDTKKFKRVR